jgi:sorbitol-specific phosphotransferase system component IIA
VPPSTVTNVYNSFVAVAVGAVAKSHFTELGHVIALPSPLISTEKPIALPVAGGLVNDTVVAPLGVKLNVVPVERSRVCVLVENVN